MTLNNGVMFKELNNQVVLIMNKAIVSHYNIQKNNDIVKDYFNFIPLRLYSHQIIGIVIQLSLILYLNTTKVITIHLNNNNGILGMNTRVRI